MAVTIDQRDVLPDRMPLVERVHELRLIYGDTDAGRTFADAEFELCRLSDVDGENDRLRTEIERLRSDRDCEKRLRKDAEALREDFGDDAQRYRWLKTRSGLMLRSEPQPNVWKRPDGSEFCATHSLAAGGTQHAPADSLDAMIDAAVHLTGERSVPERAVATVTECEACLTPDVCQLRGTCDHYSAEQLRIATARLNYAKQPNFTRRCGSARTPG